MPDNHWAADSVRKLAQAGIVSGYRKTASAQQKSRQAYSGNKPVTRYELAVTLYRFVQYMERADRQRGGGGGARKGDGGAPAAAGGKRGRGRAPPDRERLFTANTPRPTHRTTLPTAHQQADALARFISRITDKKVPVTPESQRAPIQRPDSSLGT